MNDICKVVWSRTRQQFVAVSEIASSLGKASSTRMVATPVGASAGVLGMNIRMLCMAVACAVPAPAAWAQAAVALPVGGQVVAGQGSIQTQASVMTVNQTSQRMAVDWQSFNVGAGQTVNFVQPNAQAAALNRVLGSDVSTIQGQINANGRVYLLNPNGILFTPSAQVNVGGLVASTLGMSTADFMAGNDRLVGDSTSAVTNQGLIRTSEGGTVALVAARVTNLSEISAPSGSVMLAAGRKVRLDLGGPAQIEVEEGALNALIEQSGSLRAAEGVVYLTAKAASQLSDSAINQNGLIEAGSIDAKGGLVMLEADHMRLGSGSRIDATGAKGGGTVLVGGDWQGGGNLRQATTVTMESGSVIDASATENGHGGTVVLWSDVHKPNAVTTVDGHISATGGAMGGDGGQVETSGHQLNVSMAPNAGSSAGRAGLWLLDPYNISIVSGGANTGINDSSPFESTGDSSSLGVTLITGALASNNVTVQTGGGGSQVGNITVQADLEWSANTTLTLKAHSNIYILNRIRATGDSAGLQLLFGGTDGTTTPTAGKGYQLDFSSGAKIELTGASPSLKIGNESYAVYNNAAALRSAMSSNLGGRFALGQNLSLAGTTYNSAFITGVFTGKLDGLGNAVDGLTIANTGYDGTAGTSQQQNLGFFSELRGATVRNFGVTNVNIQTSSTRADSGGTEYRIGAIAGNVGNSTLRSSTLPLPHSASAYTTTMEGVWSSGVISTASNYASDSASTGDRQAFFFAGGLVGSHNNGTLNISRSWSLANVSSSGSYSNNLAIGGLVGDVAINTNLSPHTTATSSELSFTLERSYAVGSAVSGGNGGYFGTGGLVGVVFTSGGTVRDSYSLGNATALASFGGLVGYSLGPKISSYTSQSGVGSGGTNTYAYANISPTSGTTLPIGFSTDVWYKNDGERPLLQGLAPPPKIAYVKINAGGSGVYGAVAPGYIIVDASGTTISSVTATGDAVFTINNSTPVGTASVSYLSGLTPSGGYTLYPYSTAQNYTITQRPITITAVTGQSKVYGESDPVLTYTLEANSTGRGRVGSDTFSGALTRASGESVGATYVITQGTLANSNYTISFTGANFNITPRPVTVTPTSGQSKVYGENDPVLTYSIEATTSGRGLLVGDTLTGALARASGEAAGASYAINAGTLARSNYSVVVAPTNFSITPRPITVAIDAQTKMYGENDPALTSRITSGALLGSDVLSVSRATGENVGSYAITVTNSNYAITANAASLSITPRLISITIDAKSKVYGDSNPAFTYTITDGSLVSGSALTLTTAGSNVGSHAITAANSNYTITAISANLTITPRPITITATSNQSKVYGEADPVLTYTLEATSIGRGRVGSDTFSGTLERAAGTNVGDSYAITQGTLANSNYTISFTGANFSITPLPLTVVLDPKSKIYGNSDPTLSYSITSGSLLGSDALTLSRAPGENVGRYAITAANSNYAITANAANLTIEQRTLVLSIDGKNKRSGESEPAWTYQILSGSLLSGDEISFSRPAGEAPGRYLITGSNPTYQISAADAYLTIANRIETPSLVNGLLTVAPVQPAAQATASPALPVPQVSVQAMPLPVSANASAQVSSGLMMIPVGAEQASALETTVAPLADKTEGGPRSVASSLLQSAQSLGYTGVLVVEGGVRLPDGAL